MLCRVHGEGVEQSNKALSDELLRSIYISYEKENAGVFIMSA